MNFEKAILIAFLGNYLVNNVLAGLASLVPGGTGTWVVTAQYIVFVALSALLVAFLAWWYGARGLKSGLIFGAVGFLTAIATSFVTGISGVLVQTGSLSTAASVLPNFLPFLMKWSTLALACYWLIPAIAIGWWMTPKVQSTSAI